MTSKSTRYRQNRRRNLFFKQGGLCFWCQCEMLMPEPYPGHGERQPRNLCTIDHLRDRLDITRWEPPKHNSADERTVAACYDCNQKRAKARMRAFLAQPDPYAAQRALDWARENRT